MGGKVGNGSSLSTLQLLPAVTARITLAITGRAQLCAVYNPSALVEAWKGKASWLSAWWGIGKAARS